MVLLITQNVTAPCGFLPARSGTASPLFREFEIAFNAQSTLESLIRLALSLSLNINRDIIMSTSASLLESFLGGLEASLSVLLTLAYGVAAARFGLISETAMKDVSRLCNKLFLPAILIVNVGSQLRMENLDKYWPVLVWALFYILASILIGYVTVKVFKVPAWVTIASAFNNTTSLPLLLVQALVSTNILKPLLTGDETTNTAVERAISYFLICSVIKNVLVIGLGSKLLNAGKPKDEQKDQPQDGDQRQAGNQDSEEEGRQATENTSLLPVAASGRMYTWNHEVHDAMDREFDKLPPMAKSTVSIAAALINPASISAMIAMIIGLTPFLHRLFFNSFEDGGYLKPWLTVSIQNIGNLFTALQMFVVGGLLNVSLEKKGEGNNKLSKSAVAVTFFIRFILWAAIGIPLIYFLASRTTILSDDPILWFTMMLMPIGPPAMILSTTLEVSGADEKDQISVAKVLTFFYGVTPVICIAVVAALKAAEAAKEIRGL
ncbi:hypothetical protein FRB94_005115 [Tulasnella sp. JGI-2019a]|nr:hypothetical protein FRB94_005115 [Tulasnella sp. JGI-2019a]